MKRLWMFPILISAFGCLSLSAQPPVIENSQLQTHSARGGLAPLFRSLSEAGVPGWIGYSVPGVRDHLPSCCGNCNAPRPCQLEGKEWWGNGDSHCREKRLATNPGVVVLFRIGKTGLEKLRVSAQDCELDAGGMPFHWVDDVKPSESIALLTTLCSGRNPEDDKHSVVDGAVMAIALHEDSESDTVMGRLADSGQPEGLRSRVAFWLGVARGRPGYDRLKRMLREDKSDKVREQVVFGLSLTKVPEALDLLIQTARADSSSHVRGQALFWLAQKAGERVAGVISEAIKDDPETEVKTQAVFALTQIPNGEGVPRLIDVARTNRNPEVRKQAMFWLGQSRDPRALSFIEKVLTE